MLRRVEGDDRPRHAEFEHAQPALAEQAIVPIGEGDFDASFLPRDHPKWAKDVITVSQAARDLIARLRPIVLRVLTFWDHRVRECAIGGRLVGVDATGSYRLRM